MAAIATNIAIATVAGGLIFFMGNWAIDIFGGAKTICRALARFKAKGRRMQVALRDGTERVPVIAYPKSEETP